MYIRQVPLPVSCAYFSVKCGPSHPEGSARTQESGLGRRKQAGENIMESEFFRGKSAGNFIFISLNHGSRHFLREGEVRSSMGNNFYYPGRGREPKGHSTSHTFQSIIFADFIQKKKQEKKRGKNQGVNSFLIF